MKLIKFDKESRYIKEFISLPKKIYSKKENMENSKEVTKFLMDNHPLSKYFRLNKYLIVDSDEVVARFCITTYDKDDAAYLGFYECVDNDEVAKFLFDSAYKEAKKLKKEKIIGPVDASFWNKYRLKINNFDKIPYSGEPYNKDYYFKQFKDNGFSVAEHYISRTFDIIDDDYHNRKFEEHMHEFEKKGYIIKSPSKNELNTVVEEIYYMITELYSDFPIYKKIELEDFKKVFGVFKIIANTSMVKMAYYNNKPAGFYISIPNYNNLIYHTDNVLNIFKILRLRKKPKDYIMLYMGVKKEHQGLGKAISGKIVEELRKNKLPSLGALARDGKITQTYASEIVNTVYEYVLLERKIK